MTTYTLTDGDDVFAATNEFDVVDGLGGNNSLTAYVANVTLSGGAGDDSLVALTGAPTGPDAVVWLFGDDGNDTLEGNERCKCRHGWR